MQTKGLLPIPDTESANLQTPIIVVGISAYNEEKTIARLVLKAQKNAYVVMVYDDGSSDLTGEIALRLGAVVIRQERNLGYGAALQSLFKEAKKLNADVLVTLDSGGQYDLSQIPALVKPIEAGIAQVVLGSIVKLENGLGNLQSGFRAYSKLAINQLGNISGNGIRAQNDLFQAINKSGLSICEVPISMSSDEAELADDFEPFVSILIPTRNEESSIGRCLASFVAQSYPKDKFEILIIDGLSKDRTLEIVDSYYEKLNLRLISNPRVYNVYAFNSGIQESKGEYFIIVSGHSFVEKDFIKQSVDTYYGISRFQPRIAAVGGSLELISKNTIGRLVSCLYASPLSGSSGFWRSKNPYFANTVVFGFYNKRIVQQVGCFDEDMLKGQDFELNLRLRKNGSQLFCNPEIRPHYFVRQTFQGFLRQAFDNGAAKGLCTRKGYQRLIWFVPSLFILYQVILLASFLLLIPWAALLLPLYAVYWIATVYATIEVSHRTRENILLPFVFWSLHVTCGFGFVAGLFWKLKQPRIKT